MSERPYDDSYWVIPGRLLAGEYPGARDPAKAAEKVGKVLAAGITYFLDLTSADDPLESYEPVLREVQIPRSARNDREQIPRSARNDREQIPRSARNDDVPRSARSDIVYSRREIRDMGCPSEETMREILDEIDRALEQGHNVYVHCWGGIGRTGTVIGCHFVRRGHAGEDALAQVARLYGTMSRSKLTKYPDSPQTERQREFVRRWSEAGARHGRVGGSGGAAPAG